MILTKSKILAVGLVACGVAGTSLHLRAQVPVPPNNTSLESLDPATRAMVEEALKGNAQVVQRDGKTVMIAPPKITTNVTTEERTLESLDPATRAMVDEKLKGMGIDPSGNPQVIVRDGKTALVMPGKATTADRPAATPPNTAREDALEAKIRRLEARIEKLERRAGLASSGSMPR